MISPTLVPLVHHHHHHLLLVFRTHQPLHPLHAASLERSRNSRELERENSQSVPKKGMKHLPFFSQFQFNTLWRRVLSYFILICSGCLFSLSLSSLSLLSLFSLFSSLFSSSSLSLLSLLSLSSLSLLSLFFFCFDPNPESSYCFIFRIFSRCGDNVVCIKYIKNQSYQLAFYCLRSIFFFVVVGFHRNSRFLHEMVGFPEILPQIPKFPFPLPAFLPRKKTARRRPWRRSAAGPRGRRR